MVKNEVHARISPQLMEAIKRICSEKSSNLSDVVRAALDLYVNAYERSHLFEYHKFSKSQDNLEISLTGISLETVHTTPNLLEEPTSDDVIDW
jgi:hypothetical protein